MFCPILAPCPGHQIGSFFFPGLRFRFPILVYDFCTTEILRGRKWTGCIIFQFVGKEYFFPVPTTMWEMRCCNFRACCNFCCRCSSYHGHPLVQFFFAFLYTETVASSFMDWEEGWHLWNPQKRTFYFPDERIRSSSCSYRSIKGICREQRSK